MRESHLTFAAVYDQLETYRDYRVGGEATMEVHDKLATRLKLLLEQTSDDMLDDADLALKHVR